MTWRTMRLSKIFMVVALFMVFASISGCSSKEETGADSQITVQKTKMSVSTPKNQNINKRVYVVAQIGWASRDVMNLKKVVENSQNEEVIKQLFSSKAIFPLKIGLKVNILEEYHGIVRIKPVDNDTIVWTFKNILEEKV